MTPEVYSAVRAMLVRFELNLPYFYKSTDVDVTVGIGCVVWTEAEAFALGGPSAVDAWHKVSSLPEGNAAVWYSRQCDWRGDPDALETLFAARLAKVETDLLAQFPELPTWPIPAIVATFDVAWNDGDELLHHWPHLSCALQTRDWQTASEQCATHNGPALRNDARKAAYLECLAAA